MEEGRSERGEYRIVKINGRQEVKHGGQKGQAQEGRQSRERRKRNSKNGGNIWPKETDLVVDLGGEKVAKEEEVAKTKAKEEGEEEAKEEEDKALLQHMISVKVNSRPLRQCTLSSSKLQVSSKVQSEGACKRGSYKQYDESKYYKAYEAVQSGKLSIRRAALEFTVPLSTLSDRIMGKVPYRKKGGQPQYLTESEQSELENFIVREAQIG
uniref:HTH psq-type domain-containing protein n=1 Tax=Amphimedon queenslandica TaxID=400682 RepID=A0A1X7U1B9_AMPQE